MDQRNLPIRDLGSFVGHVPSDADIKDHRSQEAGTGTVLIGLHMPKHRRRRRHHHKRHRRGDSDKLSADDSSFVDATPPSQRIQFLLGEDDDDDEAHRAHDIFCEMEELFHKDDEMEWKETARWVKFEEDVEEGGERWSKPHVATLSLHSLFELRCLLLNGTVILDTDASILPQVVDIVLDSMVASKQLEEDLKEMVRDVLLLRHRHQNQKKHRHDDGKGSKYHLPNIRSLADIGKKFSEPKFLNNHGDNDHSKRGFPGAKSTPNFLMHMQREHSVPKLEHMNTHAGELHGNNSSSNDLLENQSSSHKLNLHFMKKIPPDSEAANILVGEVKFLTHPIVAFVRLSKAEIMGDLTEVPVPTKFLFVLLGPYGNQSKFHEIGRSIATLMSDEIFHDVAYHARNREDLLAGIDEFLDQVTVLPPGEWDPSIRIEPPKSVPSQESRKQPNAAPRLPNGKAVVEEVEDEHDEPTLQRTGRLFGGLIQDLKRKIPFYPSDITDVLSVQCIASFIFLYFACLTPIITFGGLLSDATDKNMAAFESLLAGAICGIVYALCAGQPLTILGSTGPVLVFETILYTFCKDSKLDYLQFRLWIGVWTGLILILMVMFDLSALVRYITRFTEESFALLISLIFIKEAFAKLFNVLDEAPIKHDQDSVCYCVPKPVNDTFNGTALNGTGINATDLVTFSTAIVDGVKSLMDTNDTTNTSSIHWPSISTHMCEDMGGMLVGDGCHHVADVFFLSVILFFGTFVIAYGLKMMRNGRFFPNKVRSLLSDFAVLLAIILMVGLDAAIGLHTPKLEVPDDFKPTKAGRDWVVAPFGKNPWWTCIAAVVPALLATILIFMDQQITAVIVNRKENKLEKGCGYHLDLLIVAVLIIVNSFLGLPYFVAATVLSINHVMSLKKESECTAPGERPKFLGVREQRVTGFSIFFVIGLSVLMTDLLKYIPMPVLYGVFLFMGVSSLRGMQAVDRILIFFMPPKYQPDYMYLRHVRTYRVHLFTGFQVLCLACLWVIKSIKVISIVFPLMVLAMCFVRKGMDWVFTQQELKWLDDIMPETHKRQKEDEKKKLEEDEFNEVEKNKLLDDLDSRPSAESNRFVNIAVQGSTVGWEMDSVNISEEMSKTGIWKTIVANESSSNLLNDKHSSGSVGKKNKKKSHSSSRNGHSDLPTIPHSPTEKERRSKKNNKKPVTFFIEEGEEEHLLHNNKAPEIVIDPPSDNDRRMSNTNDTSPV